MDRRKVVRTVERHTNPEPEYTSEDEGYIRPDKAPLDFSGTPIRYKLSSAYSSIEFARRPTKLIEDTPRTSPIFQRRVILGTAVSLEEDGSNGLKFMTQSTPEENPGSNLARWL